MKQGILYIVLLISISGFSQKARSLQVDIGLTQTHKDFFQLYDGVVEVGAGYHFGLTKNLFAGGSFHFNYLDRNYTKSRTFVYKPKINLQYYFHISRGFAIVPGFAMGYALVQFKNSEFNYNDLQQGINIEPDLKLLWTRQAKTEFYLFGRFDFIYLNKDTDFTRLNHYRNIYLTSFGVGVNIKSYGSKK